MFEPDSDATDVADKLAMVDMRFEVDVLSESLNDADVLCESDSLLCIDADVESLKDVDDESDSLALAELLPAMLTYLLILSYLYLLSH